MASFIGPFVDGPRIVPQGKPRLTIDKLPNGRPGFRVTQPYIYGKHDGVDVGNFNCGDRLMAPVTGYLRRRVDSAGANIVEITEADGWVTAFGHLSRFARANGPVTKGMLVGYVGDTGLGGICHVHVTRFRPGAYPIEPWGLFEQNRKVRVNAGVNIRNSANLSGTIYTNTGNTPDVYSSGWNPVRGGYHGIGAGDNRYLWRKLWVGNAYRYVALPLTVLM